MKDNSARGKKNDHPSSSSPINEVHATNASKSRIQRSKRVFTPLGMSYETAFEKLHHKGLVMPIGPIKDPVPEARPPKWDPNKHCKYHQGKGHDTEECWKLKEAIQDLINDNKTSEILAIAEDQTSSILHSLSRL